MAKIDDRGNYLPFYGYSILSMLDQKLKDIEEYIRQTKYLSRHVSALPASTYHATLFNIFTHQNVPKKYKPKSGEIPKDTWIVSKKLNRDLSKAQKLCFNVKEDIVLTSKSLWIGTYPGQPLIVTATLSNEAEVSAFRKACSKTFKKEDPLEFHVTLGYIFNAIGQDVRRVIDEELGLLRELIQNSYLLQKPDVYLFSSMECFIPFVYTKEEEDEEEEEEEDDEEEEEEDDEDEEEGKKECDDTGDKRADHEDGCKPTNDKQNENDGERIDVSIDHFSYRHERTHSVKSGGSDSGGFCSLLSDCCDLFGLCCFCADDD